MCCKPYIGAITAGLISIFQSILGLAWNFQLMAELSSNNTINIVNLMIDVNALDDYNVIFGLTMCSILLNILILVCASVLFRGNMILKSELMSPWCILNMITLLCHCIAGIYFFAEYGIVTAQYEEKHSIFLETKMSSYLRLAGLFSGGFYACPALNVILLIIVFRRIKDINNYNSMGSCVSCGISTEHEYDNLPPPYTTDPNTEQLPPTAEDRQSISGWSHQPLLDNDDDDNPTTDSNNVD